MNGVNFFVMNSHCKLANLKRIEGLNPTPSASPLSPRISIHYQDISQAGSGLQVHIEGTSALRSASKSSRRTVARIKR